MGQRRRLHPHPHLQSALPAALSYPTAFRLSPAIPPSLSQPPLLFQIFFPLEAWVVGRVSDEMLSSFMTLGLKSKAFLPTLTLTLSLSTSWRQGRLCLWFLDSTRLVLHCLIPYLHNPESFLQSLLYLYTFPNDSFTKKYDQGLPSQGARRQGKSPALIKSAYLLYGQSELRPVLVLGFHLWTRQTPSCASGPPPRMCVPLAVYLKGQPKTTSPEAAMKLVKNADSKTHSRLPKETEFPGLEPWNLYSFKFPWDPYINWSIPTGIPMADSYWCLAKPNKIL